MFLFQNKCGDEWNVMGESGMVVAREKPSCERLNSTQWHFLLVRRRDGDRFHPPACPPLTTHGCQQVLTSASPLYYPILSHIALNEVHAATINVFRSAPSGILLSSSVSGHTTHTHHPDWPQRGRHSSPLTLSQIYFPWLSAFLCCV